MFKFIRQRESPEEPWLKLDNAAKIYPASARPNRPLVFRLMVELDHPIKIEALYRALQTTTERFPYFKVQIRRGFFWYWMDFDSPGISVAPDVGQISKYFRFTRRQQPQMRILVKGSRISTEFFHALTDGFGGMVFLKSLVYAYLKILGKTVPDDPENPLKTKASPEETEDAYVKYYDPGLPPPQQLCKAYHLPFKGIHPDRYRVLSAEIPTSRLSDLAKQNGNTITEYLTTVYLWSLQDIYHRFDANKKFLRKPVIRVQVPVNLRKFFPTKTLRNFTLFVIPEIDMRLGHYSFDEISRLVKLNMQLSIDPKYLKKIIYRNVRNEKSIFIRAIPLYLKDMVLRYYFIRSGTSLYSGLISNLGKINWEGDASEIVRSMRFYPPPPEATRVSIAMVSINDSTIISFGNLTNSRLLEKTFLTHFTHKNVPVTILNY